MGREQFRKTSETFVPGSMTLPQEFYTSPEKFSEEKEKIFDDGWKAVGHINQIEKPGDYFLHEDGPESVIVLRNKNGGVNTFYNVCRHRGTKVCEVERGNFSNHIQCVYHAWTYSLEGELIGAPFMKDVESFNKNEYPLTRVENGTWDGFIFINHSARPIPFEKYFEPLIGRLSKWNIDRLKEKHSETYEVRANWKYIFQNFNECYHCPTIHPLLNKFTDFVSGYNDLTEGPFLGGALDLKEDSMTVSGKMCALPLGELGGDAKKGYYYTILPNLLLNIHPDYLMYHLLSPINNRKTIVTSHWLFNPESFERSDFNPAEAIEFWDETNKQDWHVCELAQLGVQSKGYRIGPYSPRESLLAAFDRHYLKVIKQK